MPFGPFQYITEKNTEKCLKIETAPRGTPLDARNQLGLLDPPGVGHPFVILLTRIRILAAEMTTDEPLGVAVINLIRDLKPRAALDHI